MSSSEIRAFFVDIGGVLLTNGWDHACRKKAAEAFHFDLEEFEQRHHETFDCYENGKISLDDYLELTLFFKDRPFTNEQFKEFMYAQSQPHPEMLNLMRAIKKKTSFKIFLLSNEGKELMDHRLKSFQLRNIADAFFVSSLVGLRKPDPEFYRLALDVTGYKPHQVVYIDDREIFVLMGEKMGFYGIRHASFEKTLLDLQEILSWSLKPLNHS